MMSLKSCYSLYRHLHTNDASIKDKNLLNSIWGEILKDEDYFILVIEVDNILVSSCTLAIIKNLTRGARPYGIIENVVTHEEYRNKGYGSSVLRKALEIAKEKDCYKVMLMTGRKDEWVLRFYEKAGFVRGEKTGFVKYFD